MNVFTLQKNVTTSGTPVKLTDQSVDPGVPVTIKAKAANAGAITVGKSSADALNSSGVNFRLTAGQILNVDHLDNLNQLWIDSTVNGEGVEIFVGAEGSGSGSGSGSSTTIAKSRTAMNTASTMTAGAGNVNGTLVDLTAIYGAQLNIQLTNGATGPTIAAQVQIQVANDAAGTLWTNYGGALVGSTTNSAVTSWSIDLPIGIGAVRLVSGSNTAQAVTLDADISKVTSI